MGTTRSHYVASHCDLKLCGPICTDECKISNCQETMLIGHQDTTFGQHKQAIYKQISSQSAQVHVGVVQRYTCISLV